MNTFFYISGIAFWVILLVVALYFVIPYAFEFFKKIGSAISNLWFYIFGFKAFKWCRENNMADVYFSKYAYRPGVRARWHSRKGFRRLAYIRLLKMAKHDLPAYLDERRQKFEDNQH